MGRSRDFEGIANPSELIAFNFARRSTDILLKCWTHRNPCTTEKKNQNDLSSK
jgi:hypothetical protein